MISHPIKISQYLNWPIYCKEQHTPRGSIRYTNLKLFFESLENKTARADISKVQQFQSLVVTLLYIVQH
jgi:hypothetical protein